MLKKVQGGRYPQSTTKDVMIQTQWTNSGKRKNQGVRERCITTHILRRIILLITNIRDKTRDIRLSMFLISTNDSFILFFDKINSLMVSYTEITF